MGKLCLYMGTNRGRWREFNNETRLVFSDCIKAFDRANRRNCGPFLKKKAAPFI